MSRAARIILGFVSGVLWGCGGAILVNQFGLYSLDPLLVYGFPIAAAVASTVWSIGGSRKGRPGAGAVVLLAAALLAGSGDAALAHDAECHLIAKAFEAGDDIPTESELDELSRSFVLHPGDDDSAGESESGWTVLDHTGPAPWDDAFEVDPDRHAAIAVVRIGARGAVDAPWEFWVDVPFNGKVQWAGSVSAATGLVLEREDFEDLDNLPFDVPPGRYRIGGEITGICESAGYIRIPGYPWDNPLGWTATGAFALGALGTWVAGRPGPAPAGYRRRREERGGATAARTTAAAAAAPTPWVRAGIVDEAGRPVDRFTPDATFRVTVSVPWAGPPEDLKLVMTEPLLLPHPTVVTGSTEAAFTVITRPDTAAVDARLVVLEGNRVLHTARLPGEVAAPTDGPGRPTAPPDVASVETVVGPALPGAERRRFDAAFVLNHDGDGVPRLTGITGDRARVIRLDDATVGGAIRSISQRLAEIVEQPEDFEGLSGSGTRELLVYLARHGRLLRDALVHDFLGEEIGGSGAFQVVSARPDTYFPFEVAYDLPAPLPDAAVCRGAAAALASPDRDAPCRENHDRSVVCPTGFWGLSKVIERHAHQPGTDLPADFLVRASPTSQRGSIRLSAGALVAASERVDAVEPGSVDRLVTALAAVPGHAERVDTWSDWVTRMEARLPALLLLLPHTVYDDAFAGYGLEIGAGDRCWADQIDATYVPPVEQPSLIALLGCETATSGDVGYERFPGLFRRAGAEIVIATITPVLGRHAAPIAARLAGMLHDHARRGSAGVGEVMVALRRRMLHDGVPAVLVVTAFGDADWRIDSEGS